MSEKIKWDVWGEKRVIEAATEEEAATTYKRIVKYGGKSWLGEASIEVQVHQSEDNAAMLKHERDRYKKMYDEEVAKNKEAREALDKIHETLEDTSIYDRDY